MDRMARQFASYAWGLFGVAYGFLCSYGMIHLSSIEMPWWFPLPFLAVSAIYAWASMAARDRANKDEPAGY